MADQQTATVSSEPDSQNRSDNSFEKPVLTALHSSPGLSWEPDEQGGPMEHLIHEWVRKACWHSRVRKVSRKLWVADIVGLDGVWSDGPTAEAADAGLPSVVNDWVRLKLADGDADIPNMDGTRLVLDA